MVGHIRILAVVHILWGMMFLGVAFFMGLALLGMGLLLAFGNADTGSIVVSAILFAGFTVGYGILAIPSLVGGIALLMGRGWARAPILISAALAISSIPYGLALLAFTLIVLLDEDVRRELAAT